MSEDMDTSAQVRALFDEAQRLAIAALPFVVLYLVGNTGVSVIADQTGDATAATLMVTLAQLVLGYLVIAAMIDRGDLAEDRKGGIVTYFGLSLLSGIAIGVGLLFLIVPGIILFVRWAPLYGFGLVRFQGVGDAMSRSWEATKPHFWPILIALVAPAVVIIAGVIFLGIQMDATGLVPVLPSIFGNTAISLGYLALNAISMASYALLTGSGRTLADTFA